MKKVYTVIPNNSEYACQHFDFKDDAERWALKSSKIPDELKPLISEDFEDEQACQFDFDALPKLIEFVENGRESIDNCVRRVNRECFHLANGDKNEELFLMVIDCIK